MATEAQLIQQDIDTYVTTYPLDSFLNGKMNSILSRILGLAAGTGGGSIGGFSSIIPLVSANFSSARICNVPALNGANYILFMNEINRYLKADIGEYASVGGGGFQINLANFDSIKNNYHFYAMVY